MHALLVVVGIFHYLYSTGSFEKYLGKQRGFASYKQPRFSPVMVAAASFNIHFF